ncbi:hypothetical protein [Halobacillus amylolyticus]|uniref:Uncharacterized protein n=1 Tax=Halobacillus amylolyticus TaxID=2932259 RepID=A0ABY4HIF8_9BACI|nr:hypothetical protein [Halobacillus amylolyticus]UOR14188.1 hypothetical protein MUO15_21130 [Halobacillus amylolyticus]
MAESNWELGGLNFRKSSVSGLEWLPSEDFKQFKKLLDHLNLTELLDGTILEQSAAELTMGVGTEKEVDVTMQVITFNKNTKAEIISSNEIPFFARLYHLIENRNSLRLVVIEDNEIVFDEGEPTEVDNLTAPSIVEFLEGRSLKMRYLLKLGTMESLVWEMVVVCFRNQLGLEVR